MIETIVNGAMGRMGSVTVNKIEASEDMELVAGVDCFSEGGAVLRSLEEVTGRADVLIDFSHHSLTVKLLDWAVRRSVPVVLCTTGHDEAEKAAIRRAGDSVPVFYSANMSMGVALLAELARRAAEVMPDADVEIVETHHNRKADAPSGTALMLAESIKETRPDAWLRMGRTGMERRDKNEIGIHSVRRGNITGIHQVILSTDNETVTLTHEAHDRALFADGALAAARFIVNKAPGLYGMDSILEKP